MAEPKRRTNVKGRNPSSRRFVQLDHSFLETQAYRTLSPNARSLLVELKMIHNGRNNGELFLSVRDAADRMGVADTTAASNAFDELEKMGFISCTQDAHFARKAGDGSRARCWRLTWESAPCIKAGPTNDYLNAMPDPENKKAIRRMEAGCRVLKRHRQNVTSQKSTVAENATLESKRVAKFHTLTPNNGPVDNDSVQESATRFSGNGGKQPNHIVRDFATHIDIPSGSACCDGLPDADAIKGGKAAAGLRAGEADISQLLHNRLTEFLSKSNSSKRKALASSIGVNASDLSSVIGGTFELPAPKMAALLNHLNRTAYQ
ncbi:hypothetical protein [Aquisediminimonas sediminicola]|uniref:hypothetical protein n=1 Tax=Alteraquisediminimonas sediminicola TaxID=2676787 RepID=UPI001C8D6B83|nr:hypothetical protein [Aquisediminimonas sediminicola]